MIHELAAERFRLWLLQSHRPTQERADRIIQLTRLLNGHADDILGLPAPLWEISGDDKRQALDYARPGGEAHEERKARAAKRRSSQVPRLRPQRRP